MKEKLEELLKTLGNPEKDLISKTHLDQLKTWARLIDEVGIDLHLLEGIPNSESDFKTAQDRFNEILNHIAVLNLIDRPESYQTLKNHITSFGDSYSHLADLRAKILGVTSDTTNLEALKRANSEAKKTQRGIR